MLAYITAASVVAAVISLCGAVQSPERNDPHKPSFCHQSNDTEQSFSNVVPLSALPGLFSGSIGPQNVDDYVQIRNTGMLYPLVVDGKAFDSLANIFTQDVVANLSQGPVANGLPALKGALAAVAAKVNTHHNLGTQVIKIDGNGCSAESVTYFHASLLGVGPSYGQVSNFELRFRCTD